jgi:hypothetical protein
MMAEDAIPMFTRQWLFSVLLVGLLIHLLASYLRPWLDRIGGWLSRSWSNRNRLRAEARQERIEKFKRSRMARWEATVDEFRALLSAVALTGFACTCLLAVGLTFIIPQHHPNPRTIDIVDVFLLVSGFGCVLFAADSWRTATFIRIEMILATKQQLESQMKVLQEELRLCEAEILLDGVKQQRAEQHEGKAE